MRLVRIEARDARPFEHRKHCVAQWLSGDGKFAGDRLKNPVMGHLPPEPFGSEKRSDKIGQCAAALFSIRRKTVPRKRFVKRFARWGECFP